MFPRHDLILVNMKVKGFKVPDRATMIIPDKRCGQEFLRAVEDNQVNIWLGSMKNKYKEVFDEMLGTCKTYMVQSILFKHELPWKC